MLSMSRKHSFYGTHQSFSFFSYELSLEDFVATSMELEKSSLYLSKENWYIGSTVESSLTIK